MGAARLPLQAADAPRMRPDGPIPAPCMIVGEAPGRDEEIKGVPFVGVSGMELDRMLGEAGISRAECFVTNVCRVRPPRNDISAWMPRSRRQAGPEHVEWKGRLVLPPIAEGAALLEQEIAAVRPQVIVALGNLALFALTGREGMAKWRGSYLHHGPSGAIVIPTWHPAFILRMWAQRAIAVRDLLRVSDVLRNGPPAAPAWRFIVRPTLDDVMGRLRDLEDGLARGPLWIDFDLETRAGHIACAGLSWSLLDALCIPFMDTTRPQGYWAADEEAMILLRLRGVLTHPNARVRGQNLLYDCQYTARHWLWVPRVAQDTAISFHTAYPGLRKALDFQASMLCRHYVYWKDDGKLWDGKVPEDELWVYNCVDCVRTREVGEEEQRLIGLAGLGEIEAFQQAMFWPVLYAMQRGVRIDLGGRAAIDCELEAEIDKRREWLRAVLGHPLNPASIKQMQALFYSDFGLPPIMKLRDNGISTPSLDDEALERLCLKDALVEPLVRKIQELRTIQVYLSTFVRMSLDGDDRMRTSYRIDGTETYRLNSKENAFGSGGNLQNLPTGNEDEDKGLLLPNIRRLFLPDEGHTMFDMDGKGADFQVVIAEADDENLRQVVAEMDDIHTYHMRELGLKKRNTGGAKTFCHLTNYGGTPATAATKCGLTRFEAEQKQKRYFEMYPGIKKWHERINEQLRLRRWIENAFGYRRHYFDRLEGLLPEALAWIPQSTVAIVINKAWLNIWKEWGAGGTVEVLLQVHDSLVGQFPTGQQDVIVPRLLSLARITVPYPTPLIIPMTIKTSVDSWGACT